MLGLGSVKSGEVVGTWVPDLVSEEMGFKLRFWILKPAS